MEIFDTAPEEHDVVLAKERSKPLFATHGPGDGRSWREYFDDLRIEALPEETDSEEELVEVADVVYEADVPLSSLRARSAGLILANRLATHGWTVTASMGRSRLPEVRYKKNAIDGSHKAGDVYRSSREETITTIVGISPDRAYALEATWHSDGFSGARCFDRAEGKLTWHPTVTKPRPPRDWERAEGVAPTMGFNQWVDMACPRVEKKK